MPVSHGRSRTPEYRVWADMKARCRNRSNKYYGARGIKVCKRWSAFENFFADMGERDSPKHSIERLNGDGMYAPWNCIWATTAQQTNNKRPTWRYGEQASKAKLTNNQVRWLRQNYKPLGRIGRVSVGPVKGSLRWYAAKFGVHPETIRQAVKGYSFQKVGP